MPLLLRAVFFFRVIIWNNENIETVYWNKPPGLSGVASKGRAYLEIIELQIRLPDLNGDVTNIIEEICLFAMHQSLRICPDILVLIPQQMN